MSVFLLPNDYLQSVNHFEVVIVGGGLAGLTAALDLSSKGKQVLVIEKNKYPHHKVCGEYISNEVKPYLEKLGLKFQDLGLPEIDTLQLSSASGNSIEVKLPLGGFGMSRYALDHELYKLARDKNIQFLFDTATDIRFDGDLHRIQLNSNTERTSKVVLGAYGKRSNLDASLKRNFIKQKSPWLAVKGHYENKQHPSNLVALHSFPGGYGGLSQVEGDKINFCYLVNYKHFQSKKDIATFNKTMVSENPFLQDFLANSIPIFEKPMVIAQISFQKKRLIENHILMCGDTAGLIHPLCGNGMAMAIHGAKLLSEEVNSFLENPNVTRKDMEVRYKKIWETNFGRRLWVGRRLQQLMLHTKWFDFGLTSISNSKSLLRALIKTTHGKPILS